MLFPETLSLNNEHMVKETPKDKETRNISGSKKIIGPLYKDENPPS
jgi:hypothetical protein